MTWNQSNQGCQLRLRDGRDLGYHVYGDPDGKPVYFFHDFPGSHAQAALVHEQAQRAGIALVAFDRPGFGDSSPSATASIDAVVSDVYDLAGHLRHRRFAVLGVACGGPYALAAAKLLPQRVSGVGLLAGVAPMDLSAVRQSPLPRLKLLLGVARVDPWLITPWLMLDWLRVRLAPGRMVTALAGRLTPADRALVESDATLRLRLGVSWARAYAQGIDACRRELAHIAGYRIRALVGIQLPVHVFQSAQDRNMQPVLGACLTRHLPQARFYNCPEDGPLSIMVNRFAECMARLHPRHGVATETRPAAAVTGAQRRGPAMRASTSMDIASCAHC